MMPEVGEQNELIRAAGEGDKGACERIIKENSGLIWSIARRFFGRGVEAEDLYQLGCIGFIKAVRGYDPAFGTRLSTYAVPKIAGEIRRFLRDDGVIKVSRSIKESARDIQIARERLSGKLGREPLLSDISEETGIPVEEIAAAESAVAPIDSLQRSTSESGLSVETTLGDEGIEENAVERVALTEVIDALPERERMIVKLRYYKNLTQEQTAKIAGISQVQVSRIEHKALECLRRRLSQHY